MIDRSTSKVLPVTSLHDRDTIDIALVVPLQGPSGIFGPSAENCARLAVEELNKAAGIAGREVRTTIVDGGQSPLAVAHDVDALLSAGAIDAVVGWHISAVREAVAPRLDGRIPYVYTALYEGDESHPGVFLTGETPESQLQPTIRWFSRSAGIRRWAIIGNDYIWPRRSARIAAECILDEHGEVCDVQFVPLGTSDFRHQLTQIGNTRCDAVLMLLIGDDAIAFNRQFTDMNLDRDLMRFSSLIDENVLLASGAGNTRGLVTSAGFFDTLPTTSGLDFAARYLNRFGRSAPVLNSPGESCYEGIHMLAQLIERANSSDPRHMLSHSEGLTWESPRGTVQIRDRHLQQQVYLAIADGCAWDVLQEL